MSAPRLVAFDLDDTLAPSKSRIDPRIAELLVQLAQRVEVAIISGGQWGQFRAQVLKYLDATADVLARMHMMPTCGTQYYRHNGEAFEAVYAEHLDDDVKAHVIAVLEEEARRLNLWEEHPAGDVIEDRGSQITFSALGQQAAIDDKRAWDPTGQKRAALQAAVAARLPELEVRSGGSTSLDITRRGIDKAYGMRRLAAATGISYEDTLFYGDRLDEGGNDYPVLSLGIPAVAVDGWEQTAELLEGLIPTLPAPAGA